MAVNPGNTPTSDRAGAGHRLPCGANVEGLWEDIEAGVFGAHVAGCAHCTTARASLEQLAEATRMLIEEPVEAPGSLLGQIMAAVRADLIAGDVVALPAPSGAVDISIRALAAVLRFAVDGVPGLRAHRCRIEPVLDTPHTVGVWMSVSLHYGSGRVIALEQARARVGAALAQRIGLALSGVDFEVTDVWTDATTAERGRMW
ncbi:MAG: Asp23/Gls24 family envelope stress response protein [Actinomycetota bacterium]|nr:Asp23/Gls24 family envelope stress response protein [Actinomycetota bacterium]